MSARQPNFVFLRTAISQIVSILPVAFFLWSSVAPADDLTARYFEQLRQRGLYSLAESEALSRLAEADLALAVRTELQIELSRSLTEHAGFASEQQRDELWKRSRSTLAEFLEQEPANPLSIVISAEIAFSLGKEGNWLRAERETRPFDGQILQQATLALSDALHRFENLEAEFKSSSREQDRGQRRTKSISAHEWRELQHRLRAEFALAYRNRSELQAETADRNHDADEAETLIRRLIGVADEPLQSRSRLLVITCTRLKNQPDRAMELLNSLINNLPSSANVITDEIHVERIRILLELKRPTEAAELLLKVRSQHQRLTGELWYLQLKTLLALQQISIEKKQVELTNRLTEQIETTILRCEDQVGGYWSRRCQRIWENARTATKYGEQLDGVMQQARADYLAGRLEESIAGYATAEKLAFKQDHRELGFQLAYTRASILVEQKKFESAAAELSIAVERNRDLPLASKADLLAAYCLGRVFEANPTDGHRDAYLAALEQHVDRFRSEPTADDARFLKAQFSEQLSDWGQALALYLSVNPDHVRGTEAIASAARIYEILICRHQGTNSFTKEDEQEAIDRLTKFLSSEKNSTDKWGPVQAGIALHLAAILLNSSVDQSPSNLVDSTGKRPKAPGDLQNHDGHSERASVWLTKVLKWCESTDSGSSPKDARDQLRQRATSLQIVAYAASGRYIDAEQLLNSKMTAHNEGLAIIDRLAQMVKVSAGERRTRMANLLAKTGEGFASRNTALSLNDQNLLDRSIVVGYLYSGRNHDAVELATKLSNRAAKKVETQRELAIQFEEQKESHAISLVKQCWRRVESLTKQGSQEWLFARYNVIKSCVRLEQLDEARKLLQITQVLYPDLGGEAMKPKFQLIETEIRAK